MIPRQLQDNYNIEADYSEARCEDLGLEYAHRYAGIGIPVYPIIEGIKKPFDGKHVCPIPHRHGYKDATLNPNVIDSWWGREHPNANIGGVPHRANMVVMDIDGRNGGAAIIEELKRRHGEEAFYTPTVNTHDGNHFWYTLPVTTPECLIRLPSDCGIELFGAGKFGKKSGVMLPPSWRRDKDFSYRWQPGRSVFDIPLLPFSTEFINTLRELFADKLQARRPPRKQEESDEVGWLAEYDRDPSMIRELLRAMSFGRDVPFERGEHFCSPLRDGDDNPSCTFKRDWKGLFKYHDFTHYGLYFTPAHVWASWVSHRPIEELYTMERVTLACWKIRLLLRLGRLEYPSLQLPLLPGNAPMSAREAYAGFGELLQCRMAYNKASKPPPAPYTYGFAQTWVPLTEKGARYGINWLLKQGYLVLTGREYNMNLYLPVGME